MSTKRHLVEAALKGAVASVAGGMAIKMIWEAGQRLAVPEENRVLSPTTDVVQRVAARSGTDLSPAQSQAAAGAVYGGAMLAYGVVYGIVQRRFRPPPLVHAALLAGIMYAANFPKFGALPKAGVLSAPGEQSAQEAAIPVAAQAAYAVTMASVFDLLDRDQGGAAKRTFR